MNIGYAYPFSVLPATGGNKVHALRLIDHFVKEGHKVITLGDDSHPRVVPAKSPEEFLRAADVSYVRVDGYPVRQLPDIRKLLSSRANPIVVELNAPANEMLAFSWLGGRPRPTRATARWIDWGRRWLHATRSLPSIHLEERARRRMASGWHSAICVSKSVQRYAIESLQIQQAIVLENGSDPAIMRPVAPINTSAKKSDLVVLYAGSPSYPWQGINLLAEVARRAHDAQAGFHFVFLVHSQPRGLPKLPNVEIVTNVPYEEVPSYVAASDVCVSLQPDFHWSPWGFHGSPMKLFDYMACGRPILVSNVGQMAEVVEAHKCGVRCDETADSVMKALSLLAEAPAMRRTMGKNARAAVIDRYNWDRIGSASLDHLATAVSATKL